MMYTHFIYRWIVRFSHNRMLLLLFLANLSRRLKLAFLVKICPFSVVVVVVVVGVNFSHFHLLLQKHWANFNQTWHKAFLGEGDSSSNEGSRPFSVYSEIEIVFVYNTKIKPKSCISAG